MRVFTTGQVAKICGVATRTVSKWFDSGTLKGYRIPESRDRRIPEKDLREFLATHGMPADLLDESHKPPPSCEKCLNFTQRKDRENTSTPDFS